MAVSFRAGADVSICVLAANDQRIVEHRGFNIDAVGRELSVSPGVDMTIGDVANMVIKAGDLRLSMEVRVTDPADPASIVDVIPLPNEDFERRKTEEQARMWCSNCPMGFDARLGEHWLLGAGASFANTFNTDARSLEVGLHAGYR